MYAEPVGGLLYFPAAFIKNSLDIVFLKFFLSLSKVIRISGFDRSSYSLKSSLIGQASKQYVGISVSYYISFYFVSQLPDVSGPRVVKKPLYLLRAELYVMVVLLVVLP